MSSVVADPDVMTAMRNQGGLYLVFGVLALVITAGIVVVAVKRGPTLAMGIGGLFALVVAVGGLGRAAISFLREVPPIGFDGTTLTIGAEKLTLAPGTRAEWAPLTLVDQLWGPQAGPEGTSGSPALYQRLPGTSYYLPFFDGGPAVMLISGEARLTLRPAAYGGRGLLGERASPESQALGDAILAVARDGEAAGWLRTQLGTVVPAPASRPSPALAFILLGVAALALLGGAVIVAKLATKA